MKAARPRRTRAIGLAKLAAAALLGAEAELPDALEVEEPDFELLALVFDDAVLVKVAVDMVLLLPVERGREVPLEAETVVVAAAVRLVEFTEASVELTVDETDAVEEEATPVAPEIVNCGL